MQIYVISNAQFLNEIFDKQTKETKTARQIIEKFDVCYNLITQATGHDSSRGRIKGRTVSSVENYAFQIKSPVMNEMINWTFVTAVKIEY